MLSLFSLADFSCAYQKKSVVLERRLRKSQALMILLLLLLLFLCVCSFSMLLTTSCYTVTDTFLHSNLNPFPSLCSRWILYGACMFFLSSSSSSSFPSSDVYYKIAYKAIKLSDCINLYGYRSSEWRLQASECIQSGHLFQPNELCLMPKGVRKCYFAYNLFPFHIN